MARIRTRGISPSIISLLISTAYAQGLWCGKVYTAGTPENIPKGWMVQPATTTSLLLDVGVTPRHSIYVANESTAHFIVDAGLSNIHGSPYSNLSSHTQHNSTTDRFNFYIETEGEILVADHINVSTIDNLFQVDLTQLTPRNSPYQVTLTGTTSTRNATYKAYTKLWYLPDKSEGSVVKIDNLYGGLLYRNPSTNGTFKPHFPFGFYTDYSAWLNVSKTNARKYKDQAFNTMIPESAFTDGNLTGTLNELDELNLLFQYDMRGSFNNLTSVGNQVPDVKDHPSLLTWYTSDEPDGWQYAFNLTTLAYELLASMDKYHPTALVLNCQNHWFKQYTAGADIIMQDAYPVGISPNWSMRWNTTCNATYGDCGCDNCAGVLTDVSDRMDDFYTYGQWIGGFAVRKPIWAVTQAMSGQNYWARLPTGRETVVMDMLSINHGAKGRLSWIYPTSAEITRAASNLAKVVTVSPVLDFLIGANPLTVTNGKTSDLDVAYWSTGNETMVGIVNPRNSSVAGPLKIALPPAVSASRLVSQPWGNVSWTYGVSNTSYLVAEAGLPGLETSYVILS